MTEWEIEQLRQLEESAHVKCRNEVSRTVYLARPVGGEMERRSIEIMKDTDAVIVTADGRRFRHGNILKSTGRRMTTMTMRKTLCGRCAAELKAGYDVRKVSGADTKVNCESCGKRRYGGTFEITRKGAGKREK